MNKSNSHCACDLLIFKINTIDHYSIHLSSTYSNFHDELQFLKTLFSHNGLPRLINEKQAKQFLNIRYNHKRKSTDQPK